MIGVFMLALGICIGAVIGVVIGVAVAIAARQKEDRLRIGAIVTRLDAESYDLATHTIPARLRAELPDMGAATRGGTR